MLGVGPAHSPVEILAMEIGGITALWLSGAPYYTDYKVRHELWREDVDANGPSR
jgi:hypothetical protein